MERGHRERVLVTGGTGLVGSHLVELLLRKGYAVTCLVRDPDRLRWLQGLDVGLVTGDCSAPGSLPPALENVSIVFHAAGLTKARRPREYYEVNHLGTKHLLEACARHRPDLKKFILVSSLAAAGPSPDGAPLKETDPPRPLSDYGRSKLLAEEEALRHSDRFPVVILRPSAVYGPRDADMYEFFRWAARGLTVQLGGGDRFINPCYVEDLAAALALAAEKDVPSGSAYFVAEEQPCSWAEFSGALLRTGGVKARNITIPPTVAYLIAALSEAGAFIAGRAALTNRQKVREARQRSWVCDLGKIKRELGFQPAYPLARGLTITWQWYRANGWIR